MKTLRVILALIICTCVSPAVPLARKADWKAGIAVTRITPQQSMWMAGYAARKKPSEGTTQELFAKALALEDGHGSRVVIITTDILGFPGSISEAIAKRLAASHGLRRDQLVFTSSHTHSGPVVRESLAWMYALDGEQGAAVRNYTSFLQDRVVEVVGQALGKMVPAVLSLGHGEAGFGVNRRQKTDQGYVIGVNAEGPVDHEVPVLCVASPSGKALAVLFSYACHNTTLGADNYKFHGDYAGVAQEEIEKAHPGVIALFMIGCAADTNPNPRGTEEHVRAYGKQLAGAVNAAISGTTVPVRPPLRTAFDRVNLPFSPPPSKEELEARLSDQDVYRQRQAKGLLGIIDEKGSLPTQYPYPVSAVQFGKDLTMVLLAGEVLVDYDLRLKQELPPPQKLWVLGYANDVFAYIPSRRVLEEGGYEAATSMIYYGQPGPWAPEVEEVLVSKVKQVVAGLRQGAE
jgi:neutral ceramidase